MQYLYGKQQLIVFDKINPANYIFHEDTETCTVVYTEYFEEYEKFYSYCAANVVNLRKYRKFNKKHLTIGKKMQPRYRY